MTKNQAVPPKELTKESRDQILLRYRSGWGYETISKALNILKSTVGSIIVKWRTFGSTTTLTGLEGSWPERWPRTLWPFLQRFISLPERWENPPEGQLYSINQAVMVEWLDRSYSWVNAYGRHLKGSECMRKTFSGNGSLWAELQVLCLAKTILLISWQ